MKYSHCCIPSFRQLTSALAIFIKHPVLSVAKRGKSEVAVTSENGLPFDKNFLLNSQTTSGTDGVQNICCSRKRPLKSVEAATLTTERLCTHVGITLLISVFLWPVYFFSSPHVATQPSKYYIELCR